ncbi:hypothetical protein AAW12_07690 [Sphingobacterium sp. Ag1]|uniref:hypothetical protein n=1 Tax=Sphingobacterium sp. Ag1 TaxID=1643451 RepID=UPI0006275899|nr:hypothetical protein [Sphingobacterium sp. Ag1]KKO92016.1 hypothetical protein AAW12_07690 [Sphingobacterium sp. Ag1]
MRRKNLGLKLIALSWLLMTTTLFGQGPEKGGLIRLADPQPPNVAELGKYAVYPTAEYTGVVPISIPLFEISLKGKSLPFGLSYHASGIKVDQEETEVGLGWSLSGMYTISRNIIGGIDERSGSSTYNGVYFHNPKTIQELLNEYNAPIIPNDQGIIITKKNDLRALALGNNDNHSDLYTFSTKSRSGKFLVKNMNEYYTIPYSSIKISRGTILGDSYRSYPFTIVDDEGLNYLFDDRSYSIGDEINNGMTSYATTNSWYISKITDNESGEYANFQYVDNWIREYINNEQVRVGYDFNGEKVLPMNDYSYNKSNNFVDNNSKLITSIVHSNGQVLFEYISVSKPVYFSPRKFLSKIKVLNVKGELIKEVNFVYDSSTDRVKLASVTVRNLDAGSGDQKYDFAYDPLRLPQKKDFSVDYWGYYNGNMANTYLPPTTIRINNVQSYSGVTPTYTFGSADRTPNIQYMQAEMLKRITYPTRGYTDFEFENNKYIGKVRSTSTNYISETVVGLGVDQKNEKVRTFTYGTSGTGQSLEPAVIDITFNPPTPPYTEFSMHPQWVRITDNTTNTQIFEKWHDSDPSQPLRFIQTLNLTPGHNYELKITVYGASVPQSNYITTNTRVDLNWKVITESDGEKPGGGLRVKSVKSYSPEGNLLSNDYYKYGENENGLGISFFDEAILYKNYQDQNYFTFFETGGVGDIAVTPGTAYWWDRKYFGISNYSSVATSGATIGYSKVRKYQQDVVKSDLILSESEYTIPREVSFSSYEFLNSQNYGSLSFLLSEPSMIKKTDFRKYGSSFMPIKKENYTYTHDYLLYTSPLVFETNYYEWTMGLSNGTHFQSNYYVDYTFRQSSLNTSRRKPLQKIGKDYFYNADLSLKDSISTEQNFEYNAAYADEPSKIRVASSNQPVENIQEFTYPDDVTSFTGFGLTLSADEQTGLNAWKKGVSHFPNRAVRRKEYKGTVLTGTYYNLAAPYNGKVFPSRGVEQRGSMTYTDLVVNRYDAAGNPLEIRKKDGPLTVYLWGYGGQYPIAEIKNASYSEVLTVLNQAALDNLNLVNVSDAAIETTMNTLRNDSRLAGAMVTSFTYKPLVGMTSKTDARGIKETYTYDGMQRLQTILDHLNYVTKSFDYHYRPN